MNCTEFESSLHAAVEQRRPGQLSPLREHAAGCAACGEKWADHKLLTRAIAAWSLERPEADLVDAVLEKIGRQSARASSVNDRFNQRARNGSRWSRLAMTAVAAAVLLLSLILMKGQDASVAPIAENDEKPPQPELIVVEHRDEPELDLLLRDAGTAYLHLARGAADALTEVSVLVPAGPYAGRDNGSAGPEGGRTWFDRWQDELRPIGRDFERAVDFLLDAVPGEPTPTT